MGCGGEVPGRQMLPHITRKMRPKGGEIEKEEREHIVQKYGSNN